MVVNGDGDEGDDDGDGAGDADDDDDDSDDDDDDGDDHKFSWWSSIMYKEDAKVNRRMAVITSGLTRIIIGCQSYKTEQCIYDNDDTGVVTIIIIIIIVPKRAMTRTTVGCPSGTKEIESSETPQSNIDLKKCHCQLFIHPTFTITVSFTGCTIVYTHRTHRTQGTHNHFKS